MYKKIVFEKWIDPFTQIENEDEFDGDNSYGFARRSFLGKDLKPTQYKGQVITSPVIGIFPLGEHNLQSRRNNMWIGHTNFVLNKEQTIKIAKTEGVEILKVISPYRFWVGIGFLFNEEEVKNNIRKAMNNMEVSERVLSMLNKKYKAWAVVKEIDNKLHSYGGESQEKVEFLIEKNKKKIKRVSVTSWQIK